MTGEETLLADCLALSVFSLNTVLHQLYTRFLADTRTVFHTDVPHSRFHTHTHTV